MIRYLAAVVLWVAASWAHAECTPPGQKVASLAKDKAATYSEAGKVVGSVEKAAVTQDTPVLACDDNLGLIKIHLASGDVWLDRTDANITYTQAKVEKKPCIMVAQNKKDDQRTLGVAGAGGSEHCEPGKLPN